MDGNITFERFCMFNTSNACPNLYESRFYGNKNVDTTTSYYEILHYEHHYPKTANTLWFTKSVPDVCAKSQKSDQYTLSGTSGLFITVPAIISSNTEC